MNRIRSLIFVVFFSMLLFVCCGPAAEESVEEVEESPAEEVEKTAEYVLPRELDGYELGAEFEPGDDFKIDEAAAVFMFNEVKGETFVNMVAEEAVAEKPIPDYSVNVINGRIFAVKKRMQMDFAEADSMMARHLTMYGDYLDRENRPESETDMHWMNFSTENTAMRLEYLNGTMTITLSAYDLKP